MRKAGGAVKEEHKMKKGIKLALVAAVLLAAGAVAFAEIDLFDVQRDVALGKTTIVVPAEAEDWDLPAIVSCIKGGEGITLDLSETKIKTIGDEAFKGCNALKAIILPKGATSIGKWAFRDCKALTSIVIPASVTSIGYSAFYNCEALTQITIPSSVESIGDAAFYGCSGLADKDGFVIVRGTLFYYTRKDARSVVIPNSVTSIGNEAFWGCKALTQITIPSSVTSIGVGAFAGCSGLADKDGFVIVRGILFEYTRKDARSVVIPKGVTTIGGTAFGGCKTLSQITIPNSVTTIESLAFVECESLAQITIPASVMYIDPLAFLGCAALRQITFADTSGWYFDEELTQRAGATELASSLKDDKALYKRATAQAANSALFTAVQSGTTADVCAAIKAGADVNARDEYGRTALMYAAWGNTNHNVAKALLAAGADVNAQGGEPPWTVLMYAARYNTNPDVMKELLDGGADRNAWDNGGWRAIDYLRYREGKDEFYGTRSYKKMLRMLE